jgi:predicted nucleotide-binding protein (sugar kinase/HSP70/actin superfamily)
MQPKIGIPRALFYYYYFPLWRSFLEALDTKVVISPETNKAILNQGTKSAVDEACLPVKVFYGHVMALREQVDYLFVPRMVSVEKKAFICPKVMGLPDMIRANIKDLPPLIDVTVDLSHNQGRLLEAANQVGRLLRQSPRKIKRAWKDSCNYYKKYLELLRAGFLPSEVLASPETPLPPLAAATKGQHDFTILLLGHSYDIYDNFISMNLISKLRRLGARVLTADLLAPEIIEKEVVQLPKRLFWTLGRRIIGTALYFLKRPELSGIIHMASFGCGPDSLVGDLVERYCHRQGKTPFLYLTVDEHTGEAGLQTRVEAFLDMLAWRGAV